MQNSIIGASAHSLTTVVLTTPYHACSNRLESANHNPICLASGDLFPDGFQSFLKCDRDEGDILERYKAAAQAFWEWLPLRHVPGTMGKIKSGQLTKIMEWGSLATVVGFDTRLSYRSHSYPMESGASSIICDPRCLIFHAKTDPYSNLC